MGVSSGMPAARSGRRPSPEGVAALLSLLLPGLGQAWLGDRRRGVVMALPLLAVVGAALVLLVADPAGALASLIRPTVIVAVLLVVLGLGAWHLAVIADTARVAARRRTPRLDPAPRRRPRRSPLLALALLAAVGVYTGVELLGVRAYGAATAVFANPSDDFVIPVPSFEPDETDEPSGQPATPGTTPSSGPASTPKPTPTPGPAWARDGRLNLLLVGSDAGPGRWLARTDTMVVLSVDVTTGRAALFGIPRNIRNVPLPPESAAAFANGRYPAMLNSLYVYALEHPHRFPGRTDEARGFRAVTGAVQELVGVALDGVVVVNLNGFVDLVDAVGGLWIDIPSAVYDARYPLPDGSGSIEIYIRAGCRHLDGERALQYARSRHQDSDYGRMRRQQLVLVALARQLDPIALLPRVPQLLDIAEDNLWTTIDVDEIADLAVLAARVDAAHIEMIQLSPPTYPEYLRTADIKRIRKLVRTIFDVPTGALPSPTPETTPRPCPREQ